MAWKEFDYKKYLLSPKWKEKRAIALSNAKHKCQICYSKHKLEVHHRTYKRIGDELPEDLTVLCHGCHALFSKHKRVIKKKFEKRNNPNSRHIIQKQISRVSYQLKRCRWSEVSRLQGHLAELKRELAQV